MLSTRVIDGLSVYRPTETRPREIELLGGTEAERSLLRAQLDIVLTAAPTTQAFRDAYARSEILSRRARISIGLTRGDEALLRGKIAEATSASLEEVRLVAMSHWR